MDKQEIWIFGDSYAERFNEIDAVFSWPRGLEENYNVTNFALRGQGPQGVLEAIHKCLYGNPPYYLLKKITVIVVLPEICRYPYSFYRNVKDRVYGQVNLNSSNEFKNIIKQEFDEDKLNFLINFNEYYLTAGYNQKIEEMKTLALLNHYAGYFKKMLVWPTVEVRVHLDPTDNPLFSSLTNYDFVPVTMQTISEIRENVSYSWPDDRYRINHVSLLHHRIMYDEIISWIETGKLPQDKFVYDPLSGNDGNILNEL